VLGAMPAPHGTAGHSSGTNTRHAIDLIPDSASDFHRWWSSAQPFVPWTDYAARSPSRTANGSTVAAAITSPPSRLDALLSEYH
jgi:hypothetical protein